MIQKNFSIQELVVVELLKQVPDPELGVNIVDLGLIYEVHKNEDKKTMDVILSLSTPGCPVGDSIIQHVEVLLKDNYPDHNIKVDLVWEPQWTPDMITEDGKKELNQ